MSTFRSQRSNSEIYYTNQASDKKLLGSLLDNGQTQLMSEIYRQRSSSVSENSSFLANPKVSKPKEIDESLETSLN